MQGFFGELSMPVRFTVAFVVVLVLIVITAWVIKRISGGGLGGNWSRGRDHRLEVIDAAAVDPKRRLVLVRRDDKEHLILIGGATDIVVETGIDAPATPETAAEQGAEENLTDTPQGSPPDTIGAPNYEPPRIEPGIAAAAAPVAAVTAAAPVIASSGAPDDETHIATSPAGEASPEVELMHTPEVEELTTEITFDETALVAALEADVAQDLSAIEIEPIDDVRPSEPEKGVAAAQEETNEVLDATASQPAPVDMTPVIPLRPKRVIPEAETSIDADKSSDANVAQFEFDAPNMPDVADAVGSTPEPEADEALEGALSQAIAEPGEKTEAVEPTETEAQQLEPGTDLSAETASLEETLEDATDTSAEGDAVAATAAEDENARETADTESLEEALLAEVAIDEADNVERLHQPDTTAVSQDSERTVEETATASEPVAAAETEEVSDVESQEPQSSDTEPEASDEVDIAAAVPGIPEGADPVFYDMSRRLNEALKPIRPKQSRAG